MLVGLHHLQTASLVPDKCLPRYSIHTNIIFIKQNAIFFIQDKCCHIVLSLHLMELNWYYWPLIDTIDPHPQWSVAGSTTTGSASWTATGPSSSTPRRSRAAAWGSGVESSGSSRWLSPWLTMTTRRSWPSKGHSTAWDVVAHAAIRLACR